MLEAAPRATSRVLGVSRSGNRSRSRVPVSGIMGSVLTRTPRSVSSAFHGSTLAWWSSSVTTTSSPASISRPSARERW